MGAESSPPGSWASVVLPPFFVFVFVLGLCYLEGDGEWTAGPTTALAF